MGQRCGSWSLRFIRRRVKVVEAADACFVVLPLADLGWTVSRRRAGSIVQEVKNGFGHVHQRQQGANEMAKHVRVVEDVPKVEKTTHCKPTFHEGEACMVDGKFSRQDDSKVRWAGDRLVSKRSMTTYIIEAQGGCRVGSNGRNRNKPREEEKDILF